MAWSKLVDMALTDAERVEQMETTVPALLDRGPQYPYGLKVSLCEKELEKLRLDVSDASVGDLVDMRCFGTITSISQNDGPDGPCCRVEIQIERMAVENEETEEAGE